MTEEGRGTPLFLHVPSMSRIFFIFLSSPSSASSSKPSFRRAASSRRVLGSGRERESTRTSLPREGGMEGWVEGGREEGMDVSTKQVKRPATSRGASEGRKEEGRKGGKAVRGKEEICQRGVRLREGKRGREGKRKRKREEGFLPFPRLA